MVGGSSKLTRMFTSHNYSPLYFIWSILILSVTLSGCTPTSAGTSRLRVINKSSYPVVNLVVWFPEDKISFGDIPAGTTTEYLAVPNGVYRYAAYKFDIDGEAITQPVIDFVGEEPLVGNLFTFTIDFDPNRASTNDWVQLVDVRTDE